MFNLVIKDKESIAVLASSTESRALGRSLYFLCKEDRTVLKTTEEIIPRVVTCKNV